jgi:hypothetical protein
LCSGKAWPPFVTALATEACGALPYFAVAPVAVGHSWRLTVPSPTNLRLELVQHIGASSPSG